jgi:hypothetical protein
VRGRGFLTSVLLCALLLASPGTLSTAEAAVRDRPAISLVLTARSTYAYRHEYTLVVRVRSASTGRPLRALQVTASGAMSEPGHKMTAGPARLRSIGSGAYRGTIAFYMAGDWRIRISVNGPPVVTTSRTVDVVLK